MEPEGLVIKFGEGVGVGATKWKNRGSETCCAPSHQDRVKLFVTPFQRVETCCAPPPPPPLLQYG